MRRDPGLLFAAVVYRCKLATTAPWRSLPTHSLLVSPHMQALAGQKVALIESGWKHSLAVTEAGGFYSWGRNVNGQVGFARCWDERGGGAAAHVGPALDPAACTAIATSHHLPCPTRSTLAAAGPRQHRGLQPADPGAAAERGHHRLGCTQPGGSPHSSLLCGP